FTTPVSNSEGSRSYHVNMTFWTPCSYFFVHTFIFIVFYPISVIFQILIKLVSMYFFLIFFITFRTPRTAFEFTWRNFVFMPFVTRYTYFSFCVFVFFVSFISLVFQ